MKTKDIKTGIVYAKRGYGTSRWGVPVTLDKRYSFPTYSPNTSLYSGTGILVISWRSSIGNTGKFATEADAIAAAAKITEAPSYGSVSELTQKLAKKGLGIEIWQPREFEGTIEEVQAAKDAERAYDKALVQERAATSASLKEQFDRIQNDLGIQAHVFFNVNEDKVTMSPREWKKMMDRFEALIQTAGPMSSGSL